MLFVCIVDGPSCSSLVAGVIHLMYSRGPFQYKDILSYGMGSSMLKARRPVGRPFFNMDMLILVRRWLYVETWPRLFSSLNDETVWATDCE